ncbi:hypothetical protein O7630_29395 [Micromonospora sp. WMMD718]|uniref:hypothetical protein n=1 Tax=Micromonospora TaxID=1873 RepID=UPI0024162230|nr:hypothetical protein [Micromonospora sp. WMMD718]MDG4755060.1 hypothetical protein [Micromonospora sp. WMMD718]
MSSGANGRTPPILYAKLAVLGRPRKHDEDEAGPNGADVFALEATLDRVGELHDVVTASLECKSWIRPRAAPRRREFLSGLNSSSDGIDTAVDIHLFELALPNHDNATMAPTAAQLRYSLLACASIARE